MFRGLSAFPLTPADPDGTVDTVALGHLLERLVAAEVDSIGLLGSTGIYAYLTRTERGRAVAAAVACVQGRVPLMVGIGALRTDDAQDLARDAEAAGADGLLLAPVSYTPLTQEEVYRHVATVAGATRLPLCLYNNPSTTHFVFEPALIRRLSDLETVRAIKMPLPRDRDCAAELAALRRDVRIAIGYSGDWGAADALLAGADAWFSVAAGLLPRTSLALTRAAQAGDSVATRRIDGQLQPLWDLFQSFGSLRVIYALHQAFGFGDHQPPRPVLPLAGPDRRRVDEIADALRRFEDENGA